MNSVDLRLLPADTEGNVQDTVELTIQVEPNGQEVSEVRVGLNYDQAILEVVEDTELDGASPLDEPIVEVVVDSGTVYMAARKSGAPFPADTFTFGKVTFLIKSAGFGFVNTTEVSFITEGDSRAEVTSVDTDVTGDLQGSSILITFQP